MEVRQVLLARSIQMFKTLGTAGYLPEIAQKIKDRYEFVAAPKAEDLLPPPPGAPGPLRGAEFKHGRVRSPDGRSVIIHQFTLFNDAAVVDTTTSTNDSELFLLDLTLWAKHELSDVLPVGPALFVSQLEFKMEVPLEKRARSFQPVGHKITALLQGYGLDAPQYELTAIQWNFDQIGRVPPQPMPFYVDRRANVPHKENLWFSQAPLKTTDHVNLLAEFERLQ